MTGYAWLGVLLSSLGTTLAIGAWIVMAMPYFEDAPYLIDLKRNTQRAKAVGLLLFAALFSIFYAGAQLLDKSTSGALIIFAAIVIALPFSLLIGTETWEHYNPKGMNKLTGSRAVALATGLGFSELFAVTVVIIMLL
jgi:hypothetical protein